MKMRKGTQILHKPVLFLAVFCVACLFLTTGCHRTQPKDPLSMEERDWLKRHDGRIVLAHDPSAKPIDFIDKQGKFCGLAADYVHLIEKKLNFKFHIARIKTWEEVIQKAKKREVDVLCAMTKTPERERWLLFTEPYIVVPTVILVRDDIKGTLIPEKMKGKKITFTKGWVIEDYLRKNYGYLDYIPSIDEESAMKAVSTGQADAWVTTLTTSSILIQKNKITNLRVAGEIGLEFKLAFASRKDWPILNRILQKGLSLIDPKEKTAIFDKWIHIESTSRISKRVWFGIAAAAAVILLGILLTLLWNRTLRQQVAQRTRELSKELEERKRTERALRETENKFSTVFHESPAYISFSTLEDGRLLEVNDAFTEITGHPRDEALGKTTAEIGLWPEPEKRLGYIRKIKEAGAFRNEEVVLQKKNGEPLFALWSARKIELDGEAHLVNVIVDITERKESEKALQEREAQLRDRNHFIQTVLDNLPIGLAVNYFDEGTATYLNKKFEEIYGWREDELKSVSDFFQRVYPDPVYREEIQKRVSADIASGDPERMQWDNIEVTRKDGSRRVVSAKNIPIFEQNFMISTVQDVTDRRKAEAALRESEKRFKDLAEMLPEAVFEADIDLNLTFANQRALSLFGYSQRDFEKGLNGFDMLVREHRESALSRIERRFQGEDLPASEYVGLKNDGTTFPILLHAIPILQDGKAKGVRGIVVDISEIKRLESELQQAQKMEAIGNLAGGVAHEFNNVLGIILGNAELALDDVPDWNPAKESLKEIRTASFRAREVVRQILSFARKTMTALEPVEVNRVVKESLKLMRVSIPAMIDIQQNLPPEPMMILGNPTEIHQIVINLCTNAAHAMKESGGVLEVSVSEVALDQKGAENHGDLDTGDFVKLTVKDRGEGIPPNVLEKVFEPYFTTKEFGQGSGMGLAVVYGLVKKLKGAVDITSVVGEGTTVEILFPKIEEKARPLGKAKSELPGGTERILLIDDDPSLVKMTGQMLERLGYRVTGMTESTAAIERFQTSPHDFDLVITDMAMPNMSGDQLAAQLLKMRNDIPILLCTGHSDTVDEKEARRMGIRGFALKPLDRAKLAKAVRAVLDGPP